MPLDLPMGFIIRKGNFEICIVEFIELYGILLTIRHVLEYCMLIMAIGGFQWHF